MLMVLIPVKLPSIADCGPMLFIVNVYYNLNRKELEIKVHGLYNNKLPSKFDKLSTIVFGVALTSSDQDKYTCIDYHSRAVTKS